MKELRIKRYVLYVYGIATIVFFLNKLVIRPWLLENDVSDIFLIVTLSLPNLIEATFGTLLLTGILLQVQQYFNKKLGCIKDIYIYILAVCIASIYVISQELKIFNLGGNNVYDPYDVVASLIGLVGTFCIILRFGYLVKENDAHKQSING